MHVLQALEDLVHNILLVDVFEDVGSDNGMEIGIHEVKDEVDVSVVFRPDDILEPNDVFVASQFLQKDDLSECALGVCGVLKCIEVLF